MRHPRPSSPAPRPSTARRAVRPIASRLSLRLGLWLALVALASSLAPAIAAAQRSRCSTECPDYLLRRGCCPARLPAPDAPGSLRVESDPAGAAVTIDGEARGTTPLRVDAISPGVHEVELVAPGRAPHRTLVLVRPAEAVLSRIALCDLGMRAAPGSSICCWPGQEASDGACTGVPSCPRPLVLSEDRASCRAPACEEPRERDPESRACCWPGQRWSAELGRCAGRPSRCPDDLVAGPSTCEVPARRRDLDGDGVTEDVDRCLDEPEDADGHEDADGCPDPDDDGDGIADAADRCRREPEDRDGIDDGDGCPETDADGDTIADEQDRCHGEREDVDGVDDGDGCADLDDDGDGIADADDPCPRPPAPGDLAAIEACDRDARARRDAIAASGAADEREWAVFLDLWPIGYDAASGALAMGGAVSGVALFPVARDERGTSVVAPYVGGAASASYTASAGAAGRPGPTPPTAARGAATFADLRLDAGLAIGPLALGASARVAFLHDGAESISGAVGPAAGVILLNDLDDDLALWAQLAWLPDVYDGDEGLGNLEVSVRLVLAERAGLSLRLRYEQELEGRPENLSVLGGATLMIAEGSDDEIARDVARPGAQAWRENALLVDLWPVGYLSGGDTFAIGGMVSALGLVPTSRDESGSSVVAAYLAGSSSVAAGVFAEGVPVSFDLRADAGLALGPIALAASVRLAVVHGGGATTVGGSGGPTLALVLLQREGDALSAVATASWLPDVHGGDASLGNVDLGVRIGFMQTLGVSLRLRYDEQLDGRRDLLSLHAGIALLFHDLFGR